MTFHSDMAIERLALSVLDRTLPKSEWTHEAHFALVLWLLRHRPFETEPAAMCGVIMRYNDATATPNTDISGYHHTITLASLRAARHCLASHAVSMPLHCVLDALIASPFGRSDWSLAFWRRETLFSPSARRDWVAPDLAPLPF